MDTEDQFPLVCISSDDESDAVSISTFHSSDCNSEVEEMATRVETMVSAPMMVAGRRMTVEPFPPVSVNFVDQPSTSGSFVTPAQKFSKEFFEIPKVRSPHKRDPRARSRHPIELCSGLVPLVDTPLSPPQSERAPRVLFQTPSETDSGSVDATISSGSMTSGLAGHDTPRSHLQNTEKECGPISLNYSDCMICGRTLDQIRGEAIEDYLRNTRRINETPAMREMKKQAFIAGMEMGTLLFIPAGLSQAAACDGVLYTITGPRCTETLPGTLPTK